MPPGSLNKLKIRLPKRNVLPPTTADDSIAKETQREVSVTFEQEIGLPVKTRRKRAHHIVDNAVSDEEHALPPKRTKEKHATPPGSPLHTNSDVPEHTLMTDVVTKRDQLPQLDGEIVVQSDDSKEMGISNESVEYGEGDIDAEMLNFAGSEVDSVADMSDAASEPMIPKQKQGRPRKSMATVDIKSDVLPKRPRGRPRKIRDDTEAKRLLTALVFVQVAVPPILQRGRTHKGDKMVAQKPQTKGPFTLTHSLKWPNFLTNVAEVTGIDKENIHVDGMSWGFQKQKDSLPLTNKDAFKAMRRMIKERKSDNTTIIMVNHSIPRNAKGSITTSTGDGDGFRFLQNRMEDDNSRWGQKVWNHLLPTHTVTLLINHD